MRQALTILPRHVALFSFHLIFIKNPKSYVSRHCGIGGLLVPWFRGLGVACCTRVFSWPLSQAHSYAHYQAFCWLDFEEVLPSHSWKMMRVLAPFASEFVEPSSKEMVASYLQKMAQPDSIVIRFDNIVKGFVESIPTECLVVIGSEKIPNHAWLV